MQTPNLPIQVSGASSAPAAQRAKNSAPDAGGQFSHTLSREMAQRHNSAPAPAAAPAKPSAPAKQQQAAPADKQAAPKQAAAEPARPADAGAAKETESGTSAADAAQAQAAATTPVVDMLALVASFNQLAGAIPATQAATTAATMQAGLGLRPEQPQATLAQALPSGATLPAAQAAEGEAVPATPQSAFSSAMAAVDGGMSDGAASHVAASAEGLPAMARLMQNATDGAATARAAGAPKLSSAELGKGMLDPSQFANLRAREVAADAAPLPELQVSAPPASPVQQASLSLAHAANGVGAGDKIAARVGTPGWDTQVGQKIVFMAAGQDHSASLTLNPPDMGPMQVVLSVTNDLATVTFSSATPEVRQALQDAMPKLREMMSESGIALGNATVNDGSAQQQQQAQGEPGRSGSAPVRTEHASGSAAEAAAKVAARPLRAGELPGMVDTFA